MKSMKRAIYAIVILLCSLLMLGTAGAMENNSIGFYQGCIQIVSGMIVGLFFWNLLRIEENRAAHKRF